MVLWVLDTDHVSLFQGGHPLVEKQFRLKQPNEIATTIVTFEEQVRGWLAVIRRSPSSAALVRDYGKLAVVKQFFSAMQVLDFTEAAAMQYAQLLKQKLRVGTQDLRIAAIALSLNATVVTRNQRDFGQVLGLLIKDWTVDRP